MTGSKPMTSTATPAPASTPILMPDIGAGSGCDDLRQFLTKRLTLKSSASTFATTNISPYHEALLTPPLTHTSFDLLPFKAPESDRTSLSMKSHHSESHHRRRLNRACVSSGDVGEAPITQHSRYSDSQIFLRSKSLPTLARLYHISQKDHTINAKKTQASGSTNEVNLATRRCSLPQHSRRWTMPSKSASTRVLTEIAPSAVLVPNAAPLRPRKKQRNRGEVASGSTGSLETPAMITLQKATEDFAGKTSLRPEAYMSFPPPTFSQPRSSFLATFLGNGWQKDLDIVHARVESVSVASHTIASQSGSRRASIGEDGVNPPQCTTAGPVCTEVLMAPFMQNLDNQVQIQHGRRRCSTKYVSGASIYEIIWDENISTSSSSSLSNSGDVSRRISIRDNERRHSIAMDKLETQMFKGIQQSRKPSVASRRFSVGPVSSTIRRSELRTSFQNLLNFDFDSPMKDPLKSLPQSQASVTNSNATFQAQDFKVQLTTIDDDDTATTNMDFMPPWFCPQKCHDVSDNPLLENPWRKSWEVKAMVPDSGLQFEPCSVTRKDHNKDVLGSLGEDKQSGSSTLPPRRGSMLGHHTGLRKKSMSKQMLKTSRLSRVSRTKESQDNERMPLLGLFNDYHYGSNAEEF